MCDRTDGSCIPTSHGDGKPPSPFSHLHHQLTIRQAFANIGWRFYLVFIIISGIGTVCVYFFIPETKGIPLEEMAKLFGDTDVQVFAEDIHIDHNTHELVVDEHGNHAVHRVATEAGRPGYDNEKHTHGAADARVESVSKEV